MPEEVLHILAKTFVIERNTLCQDLEIVCSSRGKGYCNSPERGKTDCLKRRKKASI
jgi:hypothetical protein